MDKILKMIENRIVTDCCNVIKRNGFSPLNYITSDEELYNCFMTTEYNGEWIANCENEEIKNLFDRLCREKINREILNKINGDD